MEENRIEIHTSILSHEFNLLKNFHTNQALYSTYVLYWSELASLEHELPFYIQCISCSNNV